MTTDPAFERENAMMLRWAMDVHCALLPGCPGEHHPDCPRYPPRWATTDPRIGVVLAPKDTDDGA